MINSISPGSNQSDKYYNSLHVHVGSDDTVSRNSTEKAGHWSRIVCDFMNTCRHVQCSNHSAKWGNESFIVTQRSLPYLIHVIFTVHILNSLNDGNLFEKPAADKLGWSEREQSITWIRYVKMIPINETDFSCWF